MFFATGGGGDTAAAVAIVQTGRLILSHEK